MNLFNCFIAGIFNAKVFIIDSASIKINISTII